MHEKNTKKFGFFLRKHPIILSASLQKIPHTLRIKNGSRRCTGRAGGPNSADLRHLRNGACLSVFKTHARYTTKTHTLFFSFYRFRGFSFHRRRSKNAAAEEEEEFRRLVVYFASCLFSLYIHIYVYHSVFVSWRTRRCASISDFSLYLFDVMRRQTRRCARWERQSWR